MKMMETFIEMFHFCSYLSQLTSFDSTNELKRIVIDNKEEDTQQYFFLNNCCCCFLSETQFCMD